MLFSSVSSRHTQNIVFFKERDAFPKETSQPFKMASYDAHLILSSAER